jgi:hypothetical protein
MAASDTTTAALALVHGQEDQEPHERGKRQAVLAALGRAT